MDLKRALFVVLLALGLFACASVGAAPTASLPQRVQGEYVAGEAYRVQYVADETGFHASVRLIDGQPDLTTPIKLGAGGFSAPIKPQNGDEIGCALRNSLCGK